MGKADRYETMRLLAAVEKDRPAAARLLEDLACVAAAVLEGAEGLGLPLSAAARCAEGCGEARRGMDRSLNQKLLFTLLAAKLCDAAPPFCAFFPPGPFPARLVFFLWVDELSPNFFFPLSLLPKTSRGQGT